MTIVISVLAIAISAWTIRTCVRLSRTYDAMERRLDHDLLKARQGKL